MFLMKREAQSHRDREQTADSLAEKENVLVKREAAYDHVVCPGVKACFSTPSISRAHR